MKIFKKIPKNKVYICALLASTFAIFVISTVVTYEKYSADFIKNEESAHIKMTKIINQSMSSYFETLRILVENAVLNSAYNHENFNEDDDVRFEKVRNFLKEINQNGVAKILSTPKSLYKEDQKIEELHYWQIFKGLPEVDLTGKKLALERRKIARNILKTFKDIHYVFEMEPNGDLVFLEPFETQKSISSFNYSFRDYLRIVKNTRATGVSEGYISHDQNRTQIITVATPIFDSSNRLSKILAVSVSAATLRDRVFKSLKENMDVQDGTVFYLVDRHGHIVASSNGQNIYFPTDGATQDEGDVGNIRNVGLFKSIVWKSDTLELGNIYERGTKSWDIGSLKHHITAEYKNLNGEDVVATFMPTSILGAETINWGILIETPKYQLMQSQNTLRLWFCFLAVLLILTLMFFSYLIFSQFGKLEDEINSKEAEIEELSRQVAHDIRSPLSALNLLLSDLSELPEKKRLLLRSAISRIKEIANDLVGSASSRSKDTVSISSSKGAKNKVLLVDLLEEVITEKRIQIKNSNLIQIKTNTSIDIMSAFVEADISSLKRAFSNIISNGVEAISTSGVVVINCFRHGKNIVIEIEDTGSGISKEIVPQLMQKGATFNKAAGSGLGLYYSKEVIQSIGGRIKIESEVNKGTRVVVEMPTAEAPEWYPGIINIKGKSNIVILDDDESIHGIWSDRIKISNGQNIVHFTTEDQLEEWIGNHNHEKNVYLIDYELENKSSNGLHIIDKFKIYNEAVLVTSRYSESIVVDGCVAKNIKLLPKCLAGFVAINN